jgi:hypothetical protein
MKVKMFFAAILISGLMFSTGCEKIKSLLDVKFDANYTVDMNMTVPPASGSVKNALSAFSGSTTIDPTTNSDVAKYLNLIKSWDVTSITGTFKNVSKEAVLENGTLSFSSDAGTATWTFTNVQIKNGGTFTMDDSGNQFSELSKIFSAKKVFTATVSGKTDKDDFTFTMEVKINSTITANPLGSK